MITSDVTIETTLPTDIASTATNPGKPMPQNMDTEKYLQNLLALKQIAAYARVFSRVATTDYSVSFKTRIHRKLFDYPDLTIKGLQLSGHL